MANNQISPGQPDPPPLAEALETSIAELTRRLTADNTTWARQLRNARNQERDRYQALIEVTAWYLNAISEIVRLTRGKARTYRLGHEQAIEALEELKERQRIEQQRRRMEAASTNAEKLQGELQQLHQWKREATEHRRHLANKINEMLTRYNALHQYEKEITAQLEAAEREIRRLRQELDAHSRAQGDKDPQEALSDRIASIRQGLDVASEEIAKAMVRRGILKTTVAQLSPPPRSPGQSKADPLRLSARRPSPISEARADTVPLPRPPVRAVATPAGDIRENEDFGQEETTLDDSRDTIQDDSNESIQEEGDTEGTEYTEEDIDIDKWPKPRIQEEDNTRPRTEPAAQEEGDTTQRTSLDAAVDDNGICRSYNKILRDIEEIVENRGNRNWYIYAFDDHYVSSIHEEKDKASHTCILCENHGGWDSVSTRARKLRARSRIFEILYNMLLEHCEWTQAEESVEMIVWFLKRCKVPPEEIQKWFEQTYSLFPDKQPGAGRAVDATRGIFEYFQPILSPNATRLDKTELLKRISLLCHATHALGKKLYKSRIYELRRVPPGDATRVPVNTFWIGKKYFENLELESGAQAGFRGRHLRSDSRAELVYGLSAALLKRERRIEDPEFAPRVTVREKAHVVMHRRSASHAWHEIPLVFRLVCCVALVLLYFQYIIWLPDIWKLSEMPAPS